MIAPGFCILVMMIGTLGQGLKARSLSFRPYALHSNRNEDKTDYVS